MGRPLSKKYMGNRNVGTNSPTDDGIGGKGVASVSTATQGSININDTYKHFPALTGTAPTIANGTTATYAVTWEIESITVGGTNTGYTASQTNAPVTALVGLYVQASVAPVLTINTNSSGNVSAINITSRGSFTSIDGTGITTWGIQGAGGSNAQATVKFRVKSIAVVNAGDGYVTVPAFIILPLALQHHHPLKASIGYRSSLSEGGASLLTRQTQKFSVLSLGVSEGPRDFGLSGDVK